MEENDFPDKTQSVLFYDWRNCGNKEALMDYLLAWTFKMCDKRMNPDNDSLLKACRQILERITGAEIGDADCRIQTYFEWENIDLIVEVYLNGERSHAILIENKVESKLKDHQLCSYLQSFDGYYGKTEQWQNSHKILLRAYDDEDRHAKYLCDRYGFRYMCMDDLSSGIGDDLTHPIFIEFWKKDW